MYQWSLGASKLLNRYQISLWLTHLVSKPKQPQNLRPRLYSTGTPHGHLQGGYEVSEDCQAFEARCQDSRHFKPVDSELASWETSKHVS